MKSLLKDPHRLHKYGTLLLWAGVLVWAPFFALRITGETPSLFVYLPFHLLGVIGGSRIRTAANKQLGKPKAVPSRYKKLGHYLVIASLLVWIPYYALKLSGQPADLNPYLTLHLIGIIGGTGVMASEGIVKYFKKGKKAVGRVE
jgi:hypothetical protein